MTAKRKKTFTVEADQERCKGCGLCVAFCPRAVLALSRDSVNAKGYPYAQVEKPEACIGCRNCVLVCPDCALEIYETTNDNGERP